MMAIVTRYLGPTDHRGSRVKAMADWGEHLKTVVLDWDDALNSTENHARAANALAVKLEWRGRWIGGGIKTGYVFVRDPASGFDEIIFVDA